MLLIADCIALYLSNLFYESQYEKPCLFSEVDLHFLRFIDYFSTQLLCLICVILIFLLS